MLWKSYVGHIAAFKDHFGDRYIDEVRKIHVADFIAQQKRRGLKAPMIRRYLSTLSSLLSFAERSGWLAQNSLVRFDKRALPEARPRTRFLSHDEYRRLLAAAQPHLRPIVLVRGPSDDIAAPKPFS